MAGKQYHVQLPEGWRETFDETLKNLDTGIVTFEGDHAQGKASGKGFVGSYTVIAETLLLTVLKKPMLVPWGLLKAQIESHIGPILCEEDC